MSRKNISHNQDSIQDFTGVDYTERSNMIKKPKQSSMVNLSDSQKIEQEEKIVQNIINEAEKTMRKHQSKAEVKVTKSVTRIEKDRSSSSIVRNAMDNIQVIPIPSQFLNTKQLKIG